MERYAAEEAGELGGRAAAYCAGYRFVRGSLVWVATGGVSKRDGDIIGSHMAKAYFITFTTYGTWLHGTSKGKGSVDRQHNQYGSEFIVPDARHEAESREAMTQTPYVMASAGERQVACEAIIDLCRQRGWRLLALHVRTNHVHAVVEAAGDADRMMSGMKARASRALTRAGFDDASRRRWTRHGSTLHLFDEGAVADKIHYTLNRQGPKMAYYDGRG